MKNVNFLLLFVIIFVVSCAKEENNIPIFGYSLQHNKVQKLKLIIKELDSSKEFDYVNATDSIKNIKIIYNLEKDFLLSEIDTFYVIKNIYNSKNLVFKMYQSKEIKSHNRTLVFNKDYGLLASLAIGADFIFLKDSIANIESTEVFKEIFLDLNKINKE